MSFETLGIALLRTVRDSTLIFYDEVIPALRAVSPVTSCAWVSCASLSLDRDLAVSAEVYPRSLVRQLSLRSRRGMVWISSFVPQANSLTLLHLRETALRL